MLEAKVYELIQTIEEGSLAQRDVADIYFDVLYRMGDLFQTDLGFAIEAFPHKSESFSLTVVEYYDHFNGTFPESDVIDINPAKQLLQHNGESVFSARAYAMVAPESLEGVISGVPDESDFALYCFPVSLGESVVGAFLLGSRSASELEEDSLYMIASILSVLGFATGQARLFQANQADNRALRQAALYDPLTQLPNRRYLNSLITDEISQSQQHGKGFSVGFIDLDGFKPVNDTFGHQAGDELLSEIARRIQDSIRGDDIAARISGDEFAVVLQGGLNLNVYKRILKAIGEPHSKMQVSASIGVTVFPDDGQTAQKLLADADAAMYEAKGQGKNRIRVSGKRLTI